MNEFRFNPIGQGLFYTGSLMHDSFNFVYDCGTENKSQYLDEQIDNFKCKLSKHDKRKPYIDFIVISHLHKDHISGLYKLLNEFDVGDLYLPYFGKGRELFATYLAYALFDEDDIDNYETYRLYRFLFSLYGYDDLTQMEISVQRIHRNEDLDSDRDPLHDRISKLVCSIKNLGEERLKNYWKFVLINQYCENDHLANLNKIIKDELDKNGITDVLSYIRSDPKNVDKLREIYQEVFCTKVGRKSIDSSLLNKTSTMLLHYPLYKDPHIKGLYCSKQCRYECQCYYFHRICKDTATLLTGDALIDGCMHRQLINGLNGRNINILQVPHHGSKENWDTLVKNKITASTYVLPFGLGNRHKHPHVETIDHLISNKLLYFCVTQNEYFIYTIG